MVDWAFGLPRGGILLPYVAVVLLSGGPAPTEDTTADETWKKESAQWFETIRPGATIRIVNPVGGVYARFGGYENRVELLSTTQRQETDPGPVVSSSPTESGLDVVVRPGPARDPGSPPSRVDLVVFVPLGASLDAQTEDDQIQIKGVKGNVIASSGTGDVWIRAVEGSVRAKSARGDLSVALETGATRESQDFTTETGNIEVHLWEDADLAVRIATSGEISTDFSLQIEHLRGEEPGKRAVAVVGDGGPELILNSKRGRVSLLRLQKELGSHGKP